MGYVRRGSLKGNGQKIRQTALLNIAELFGFVATIHSRLRSKKKVTIRENGAMDRPLIGRKRKRPRAVKLQGRGFACSSWMDANELLEFIEGNCEGVVLRVAPSKISAFDTREPKV